MFNTDLSNCDREPIHIPGKVQSHGFLIVTDENDVITHLSDNAEKFLGIPANELLGQTSRILDNVLSRPDSGYVSQLISMGKHYDGFRANNPYAVNINYESWNLLISVANKKYLLDFEPERSDLENELQREIGRSLSEMLADKELSILMSNTADQIKRIIRYDRVMVYKFHRDGHGEVVAEAKEADLEPWLGLHYPASDIPQQARELYKINLVRLIADVDQEPAELLTFDPEPLDLTNSSLRAVSPIHIQYLKNMGVASSFSISILDGDQLWGLIACHNYTPRFINYRQRESAKLVGQVLSSAISFRQQESDLKALHRSKEAISELTRYLLRDMPVPEALLDQEINILNVVEAGGAALFYEQQLYICGETPDRNFILELCSWLPGQVLDCFNTHHLAGNYPDAVEQQNHSSGILVCRLSKELNEFLIWFRPEYLDVINWAGNPNKSIQRTADGLPYISPRKSFEIWSQEMKHTSVPWEESDLAAVHQLREEVNYSISRKATELRILNEKLREAYAELDAFSYTISHDLKNPLTTINSYAQLIAREKDMNRVNDMSGRIQEGVKKMLGMIDEVLNYSRVGQANVTAKAVNMQKLLNDLKHDLIIATGNTELTVQIGETPVIKGDELMVQQVFANLVGNAVKYSGKTLSPRVIINGEETNDAVIYTVSDNGIGISHEEHSKIFELFSRAGNHSDFEGSGVGLAIVKRIVEKLGGKIWLESSLNEGATFFVKFKKNEAT